MFEEPIEIVSPYVIETQEGKGRLLIKGLSKDGVWVPLFAFDLERENIKNVYRTPVLLRISYEQEFKS